MQGFIMTIGLEVHVELSTRTKLFCGCPVAFGGEPNTHCCPICTAEPGTLPVLNKTAIEYAIMAGIATHCTIASESRLDRKNYFYPDLPKAYQLSQLEKPLCTGGYIDIETSLGKKRVGVTRIHIEEDAGKLVHDKLRGALIDYNRGGVPLIEVVSEPDMSNAEEAVSYLMRLRDMIVALGISDAKLNEGSFRCDVNLSLRPEGQAELGTRVEIKNLNSFKFIAGAIEAEALRQARILSGGRAVVQETRRYDAQAKRTISMRRKENADDYRYFPDPDVTPLVISRETVERLTKVVNTIMI